MKIVFKNANETIGIITPVPGIPEKHTIQAVALKDTPEGLPFWIVDDSEIPIDRTFRNAWEVPEDWGEPDGYGSQFYSFEEIEEEANVED